MNVGRLVLVLVAVLILGAAAEALVQLRSWHAGEEVLVQTLAAPDAAHLARVVSVREPGRRGKPFLVVRVARAGAGGQAAADSGVLWLENALDVTIRWESPKRLTVEYPAWASVDGKVARAYGVRVTAVPMDSAEPGWVHERPAGRRR